jgi:hypothetical protein
MSATKQNKKKLNFAFYFAFIVATVAITKFFTSYKYFNAGDRVTAYAVIALCAFALAGSLFFMAFEIYSEEKAKDNLRVSFAPFDSLYKRFKVKEN